MTEEVKDKVDAAKPDKPDFLFQLSENYAIDTDPRNIILLERYEKREGRGKHAPIVKGVYHWKEVGYHSNLKSLLNTIVEKEIKTAMSEKIEDVLERIEKLKEEMLTHLNEKIEIKLN